MRWRQALVIFFFLVGVTFGAKLDKRSLLDDLIEKVERRIEKKHNAKETKGDAHRTQEEPRDKKHDVAEHQEKKQEIKDIQPVACGRPAYGNDVTSRVVGGQEAKEHAWPWMVSLRADGRHICGASVISRNFAITAAHCSVEKSDSKSLLMRLFSRDMKSWRTRDPNSPKLTLVAGDYDKSVDEGTEQTRNIAEIIVHPEYEDLLNNRDIALMRLDEPFEFRDEVSPVCIGDEDVDGDDYCMATGWGQTQDRDVRNDILRQANLPILPRETCANDYGRAFFTDNMMCAGFQAGGIDTCQGDSGGPLVCSRDGAWALAGLTSFGDGCALPQSPGVYTRVVNFKEWVKSTVESYGDTVQFL